MSYWQTVPSNGHDHCSSMKCCLYYHRSFFGQSHASATTEGLLYLYICGLLLFLEGGGCLRFKHHWMFQIYFGSRRIDLLFSSHHSYLFPLLDVLYKQVERFTFWTVRCTKSSNHNSDRHEGVQYTMTSAWDSKLFYIYHINGNKQALLSGSCQLLSDWPVLRRSARNIQGISLFKIVEHPMLDTARYRPVGS